MRNDGFCIDLEWRKFDHTMPSLGQSRRKPTLVSFFSCPESSGIVLIRSSGSRGAIPSHDTHTLSLSRPGSRGANPFQVPFPLRLQPSRSPACPSGTRTRIGRQTPSNSQRRLSVFATVRWRCLGSEFSLENEVIKPYLHGLCVGKFRTNVAAVAGSCDCVQRDF